MLTPAMEAGLTNHVWNFRETVSPLDRHDAVAAWRVVQKMDDWNMNPERGKPWRQYVVVGILAIVALLTAVAYAVFYYRPTFERVL
jgi:hypothetical protein